MEEQLLTLRAELEKNETTIHSLNQKIDAFHRESSNFRTQNEEFSHRVATQEAVIQSLENELRVAHADDALTKV